MKRENLFLMLCFILCSFLMCGCTNGLKKEIASKTISDTVEFGRYNDKPIEWEILDKDDDNVLLISKYVIDDKEFDETEIESEDYEDAGWENSSIRQWLNEDFFNDAFDKTEQKMILTSVNENINGYVFLRKYDKHPERNSMEDVVEFKETEDKVFLLSVEEIEEYYGIIEESYSLFSSSFAETKNTSGEEWPWWSRTVCYRLGKGIPGTSNYDPCMVGTNGMVNIPYLRGETTALGIRPVIRVDVGSRFIGK